MEAVPDGTQELLKNFRGLDQTRLDGTGFYQRNGPPAPAGRHVTVQFMQLKTNVNIWNFYYRAEFVEHFGKNTSSGVSARGKFPSSASNGTGFDPRRDLTACLPAEFKHSGWTFTRLGEIREKG